MQIFSNIHPAVNLGMISYYSLKTGLELDSHISHFEILCIILSKLEVLRRNAHE